MFWVQINSLVSCSAEQDDKAQHSRTTSGGSGPLIAK